MIETASAAWVSVDLRQRRPTPHQGTWVVTDTLKVVNGYDHDSNSKIATLVVSKLSRTNASPTPRSKISDGPVAEGRLAKIFADRGEWTGDDSVSTRPDCALPLLEEASAAPPPPGGLPAPEYRNGDRPKSDSAQQRSDVRVSVCAATDTQ